MLGTPSLPVSRGNLEDHGGGRGHCLSNEGDLGYIFHMNERPVFFCNILHWVVPYIALKVF